MSAIGTNLTENENSLYRLFSIYFLLPFSAVKDCDYVIHVASPFPNAPPEKEDEVLTPAVEGTKRVLEACAKSGTVKRVIVTSSAVAIYSMYNILITATTWYAMIIL